MTRIEKLDIQGFKSFSRKTSLTFPSNFSVICGPNGSGKSNILDALCFVLGRTSAKSLRADRMMEMIFHGTKNRPPAELAKVSMHFDNSSKEFPFEDDKVILSRRINRKGISIYKLNGRTVTRERIQEILRPVRIRPGGHNIILQGDVTEIVEMSPLERREIIDEISGIKEFDQKRDKAQRELMTVENRLKESHIILHEKRSNLVRLEKESKDAQRYQKLTRELDKLRASLARHKLSVAEKAMAKLDEKISNIETGDIDKEVDVIEKELERVEKERDVVDKRLFDRTKDIAIIKEVEKIRSEINRNRDKIDMGQLNIRRTEDVIRRLEYLQQKEREGSVSKAVKEIMNLGWTGVYGTISSLSKVSKKHQSAIEVAAGPHLNDIIVSDERVAIECVNHLKKNKIGRATFLPLNKIKTRDSKGLKKFSYDDGFVGIAIDLVEFDNKYYNAFSHVFGSTVIANTISDVRRMGIGNARFVTLEGDLIERSGAIIGGYYIKKRVFSGKEEIEKYTNDKAKLAADIKVLEKDIVSLKAQLESLTTEEETGSKELTDMQKKRQMLEEMFDSLEKKRKSMFHERMNSQESINKLRIRKARLEAELENLKLEFENYKKTETLDITPSVLENRIHQTTVYINALGLINMKALEEYDEQKIIFTDLKEKVDKLTEERNKILEIIAEIEGKRKESFTKTLDELRKEFKIVFHDLMKGEADLRLIGGMDSGLLIEGSAKTKKMMNIDLMSGGEKTLTALAFLFAIQRFRPAPFYILDEIDAALDKPNTKKTVELIKKYCDNSQFIVISHNEATIQAADSVYGVSMEEGESRLVGIKMPG
ncbi:MAG: chromosome segregation SMC family protein [Candidatus Aenigmatarchaeota archaeon]